jgi:hypothetical protein
MLRHLAGVSVGKNFPSVLSDDFASTENWNLEKIFTIVNWSFTYVKCNLTSVTLYQEKRNAVKVALKVIKKYHLKLNSF